MLIIAAVLTFVAIFTIAAFVMDLMETRRARRQARDIWLIARTEP